MWFVTRKKPFARTALAESHLPQAKIPGRQPFPHFLSCLPLAALERPLWLAGSRPTRPRGSDRESELRADSTFATPRLFGGLLRRTSHLA